MKKIIAMLLALCMVFALCACGQPAAPAADQPAAAGDAPRLRMPHLQKTPLPLWSRPCPPPIRTI